MSQIAIDIDETLYSFDNAIRDAFFDMAEEYNDKSILRMAYSNNAEWRNLVDHDQKLAFEAIERVHSKTKSYKLFDHVHKVLWDLKNSGHNMTYVGSRKRIHQEDTELWLASHDLPDGDVVCVEPPESKLPYLRDCQHLIDDRPKTILDFLYDPDWLSPLDGQRRAYALWRPYNQNLTEVRHLYLAPTWRGLEFYMKRKGLIK